MPRQRHDPTKNLVGFLVGDVAYAVRIETVREILNPLSIVELPRAPLAVRGVAAFRGEVVPVIDLRVRFALDAAPLSTKKKWIVVDVAPRPKIVAHEPTPPATAGRFVALVVDSVTEVFGTGGEEIRPAPPLGSGDDLRGIEGVAAYAGPGGLVFVLDVRAFSALADAVARDLPPSSGFGAS
jgi:purine-binding chemotaxis protein CheW